MKNNPVDQFILSLAALIVFLFLLTVLAVSCSGDADTGIVERQTATGFEYETLVIEGMPCILWEQSDSPYRGKAGLTCNWDHWTGSKGEWADEREQE
jgi:hypothetical protein